MKLLLAITLFICLGNAASAQDKSKKENVRELMKAMGAEKQMTQMMKMMINSYKTNTPNVSEEFWDEFLKEVKTDELIDLLIPIYEKNFTDEEILDLTRFYKSAIGQKLLEKNPAIMQESYAIGQEWGKKLGEKVVSKLQAKGYSQ